MINSILARTQEKTVIDFFICASSSDDDDIEETAFASRQTMTITRSGRVEDRLQLIV